jgi:hypothetical protein
MTHGSESPISHRSQRVWVTGVGNTSTHGLSDRKPMIIFDMRTEKYITKKLYKLIKCNFSDSLIQEWHVFAMFLLTLTTQRILEII